jgi:hypothetical protein
MTLCSLWACPKKNSFGDLFFDRCNRIADFHDGCPQNVRRHAKLLAPIAALLVLAEIDPGAILRAFKGEMVCHRDYSLNALGLTQASISVGVVRIAPQPQS